MLNKLFLIFLILLSPRLCAKASTPSKAKLSRAKAEILETFDGVLWGFSFINENEVLVSLRKGELFYYNLKTKEKKKLQSPKVKSKGQGGLLDVKFIKIGDKNYVYLTFSEERNKMFTTSLARGVYKNKSLKDLKTIFRAKVKGKTGRHFGSRLLFKDNYIFMSVGDRGVRKYAQDLSYHNGKILRLTLDGEPASKNPFVNNKKALPEIWSYGHRNPQGIDLDPVTQKIYSIEFGPRGGDELNLIKKSQNYGWPVITYGREYFGPKIGPTHKKGMVQPVTYWTPSISPSGMAFYDSDKIKKWKNNLFVAALGSTHLRRLELKKGKVILQEKLFEDLGERIRQVRSGPDGLIYFSTDSGKLMRASF